MFLLTLLGCPIPEPTPACEYTIASMVDTTVVPLAGEAPNAAFVLSTEDPPPGFEGFVLDYTLTNLGDSDCAVAIYGSTTEPDPGAIPAVDASANPPPEAIPGVGERLARANLAPAGTNAQASSGWNLALPAGESVFVTVLACDGGHVEASLTAYGQACEDVDTGDVADAFEMSRVW